MEGKQRRDRKKRGRKERREIGWKEGKLSKEGKCKEAQEIMQYGFSFDGKHSKTSIKNA